MTDLAEVASGLSELATAARTAALAADDDPTTRERVDAALDRMTRIEESIALLMDEDVEDMEMPDPVDHDAQPVAAGLAPPFKKKGDAEDGEKPDNETDEGEMPDGKPKADGEHPEPDADENGGPSDGDADNGPAKKPADKGEQGDDEGIANIVDLHNAIRAIGDAPDRDAERARIKRRARALGAESEIPDAWE